MWEIGDRRRDFWSMIVIFIEGCNGKMGWMHLIGDGKVDKVPYMKQENENSGTKGISNLIQSLIVKSQIPGGAAYNPIKRLYEWIKE